MVPEQYNALFDLDRWLENKAAVEKYDTLPDLDRGLTNTAVAEKYDGVLDWIEVLQIKQLLKNTMHFLIYVGGLQIKQLQKSAMQFHKEKIFKAYEQGKLNQKCMKMRTADHKDLDQVLFNWLLTKRSGFLPVPITCDMLKKKANEFAAQLSIFDFITFKLCGWTSASLNGKMRGGGGEQ